MKIIPYAAPNIDIKNFSSGCYIFRCFDFYSWRSILSNGSEEITAWKHGDALHLLSFFIAKMSIYLLLFLFGRLWVRDLKEHRNFLCLRSFDIFRVPTGSRNHILWSSKINMCIFMISSEFHVITQVGFLLSMYQDFRNKRWMITHAK